MKFDKYLMEGKVAGILFWVLLLASASYTIIQGIENYTDVPLYLVIMRITELIGFMIGAMFLILFLIGFIAIVLTLFRPSKNKLKITRSNAGNRVIEVGEYIWQEK